MPVQPQTASGEIGTSSRSAAAATDVVILCGGRGTRLGALSAHTPKPLLPVGGEPFLGHIVRRLQRGGFRRVLFAAQHLAEQFHSFLAAYRQEGLDLRLIVEPEPLGTGGALRHAVDTVESPVFVALNGDTWLAEPVSWVLEAHLRAGRQCTAVIVRSSQVDGGARQKGVWRIENGGQVTGFTTEEAVSDGWINAGCYIFDSAVVRSWPGGRYSLEAEAPSLLRGVRTGLWYSDGRLLDIGTPACYAEANRMGLPAMESSSRFTHVPHHRDTERPQKHREGPSRSSLCLCGILCFCGVIVSLTGAACLI